MARLLYASILVAAMLTPPAALAEQTITFKVPVQLSNLHSDVKKFSVSCHAAQQEQPGWRAYCLRQD
jgi:hypothetical protein